MSRQKSRNLDLDTMSAVQVDGGLSDWFATVVGVLQGCILSPLLFNIFLEVVMAFVLDGNEIGADINGHCISNLGFADDISPLWLKASTIYNSW